MLAALALWGCAAPDDAGVAVTRVPTLATAEIETDADGRCFGRDVTPAQIETVTAQVRDREEVRDAAGAVLLPATYRSETRQQIVRERQEVLFETICPPGFTQEFVASLQRALAARGHYDGPVHGTLDAATGRAVQDFQRGNGPDSPLLAIDSARLLGLVVLSADQIDILNGL